MFLCSSRGFIKAGAMTSLSLIRSNFSLRSDNTLTNFHMAFLKKVKYCNIYSWKRMGFCLTTLLYSRWGLAQLHCYPQLEKRDIAYDKSLGVSRYGYHKSHFFCHLEIGQSVSIQRKIQPAEIFYLFFF